MGIKAEILELPKRLAEINPRQNFQVPGETSLENIPKKFGNGTGFTRLLPRLFEHFGAGTYPKGYNARVHGPYYPSRFYGKADVSLMDCKLGELGSWIGRREKGLRPFNMLVSRGWWRYCMKYRETAKPAMYILYAYAFFGILNNYVFQYGKYANLRHAKYH